MHSFIKYNNLQGLNDDKICKKTHLGQLRPPTANKPLPNCDTSRPYESSVCFLITDRGFPTWNSKERSEEQAEHCPGVKLDPE